MKYVGDLEVPRLGFATTNTWTTTFDNTFGTAIRANTPMQIHHAVPRDILNKFPELNIHVKQMHSIENLRGIPNTTRILVNGQEKGLHAHLTQQWVEFNNNHVGMGTIPTVQDLFDFAKRFDDQYGHLYNPPIR